MHSIRSHRFGWPTSLAGVVLLAAGTQAQIVIGLVDHHQKQSASAGGFAGALDNEDKFGSAVAALGDIDGDGVADLAVGSPGDDDGDSGQGAVWLLLLEPGGGVKSQSKISASAGGFTGVLHNQDQFGSAVAALGDLDGDGVGDLAVGAPGDDDGGSARGAVWVLFLSVDGSVKSFRKISATEGGFAGALDNVDQFGSALASLGNLGGSPASVLAVGAPGDDDGGSARGSVWMLFLAPDGSVQSSQKISQDQGGFSGALDNGDSFGYSVAALGDLDGDGLGDLAAGAPSDDDGGSASGAVWVLLLQGDGGVKSTKKISSTQGGFSGLLDNNDSFGSALAALDDLDGNGVADLAAGAPKDDDGGSASGAVWLLFLGADGTVQSQRKISASEGGFTGDLDNDDRFGSALASQGDLDGNGLGELSAGAPNDDDGGSARGAAWTLFLAQASATSNPGTGVNPNLLIEGPTPPKIGLVWDPILVAPSGNGDPLFHFMGASLVRAEEFLTESLVGPFGELLISLAPGDLVKCLVTIPGMHFAIPIPLDAQLVGLPIYTQGAVFTTSGGLTLTNGLDIVIGF